MTDVLTLTDQTWDAHLNSQPALVLFSTGDDLRSDFSAAFRKAAAEQSRVLIAQLDPRTNPRIAAQMSVAGDTSVLIGWYDDAEILRRTKPWGQDISLAIEILERTMDENPITSSSEASVESTTSDVVENQPSVVTDASLESTTSDAVENQPSAVVDTSDEATTSDVVKEKPFVVTDASFQTEVVDFSNDMPVLVDFWAAWCGPCRMVAPIMEKLAADFGGQVRIAKVDTDANPALSQAFRIMSIPTIMAFKQGQLVFNQAGAFPEPAFRDLVQQLIDLNLADHAQDEHGQVEEDDDYAPVTDEHDHADHDHTSTLR